MAGTLETDLSRARPRSAPASRALARVEAPLLVVSNRLPYDLPRDPSETPRRNVGGLVNALEPVLEASGGAWVGWDGALLPSSQAVNGALARPRTMLLPSGLALSGVPLSEREIARYYNGVCNRSLWPLFHSFPDHAVYFPEDWDAYVSVNRRFAEVAMAKARRGGRIWIHDFQLTLVPGMLREIGFGGRIDFFLHIPFPPVEIFRVLPWRAEILKSLLAADAVVFHLDSYRDNFVAAVGASVRIEAERASAGPEVSIRHAGRETAAASAPIGIDVEDFESLARDPEVIARARRVRAAYGGRTLVFGAERLDYTKGVLERFLAIERLLRARPELAGRFVFVQVVVPSRHQVEEYRAMKREIDRHVGRINGEFGVDGWQPIQYRYRAFDRRELVAHFLAAAVALVTPLRDGMNLVAAEFVASRVDGDGVLVLSEFAGIASLLDGAVRVNPNDLEAFAAAIARALAMAPEERRERMARMRPIVTENPARRWAERCLRVGRGEMR